MPSRSAVAVFGGTFDPVHVGHLTVAREAKEYLGIDDFRLVPAGRPPHREHTHAPARHRLTMLRLALEDQEGLTIDTRELERKGPSWMVDTLRSLREEHPDAPLVLVLGRDSANTLDSWREWRMLPALAHLAVLTRAGESVDCSPELAAELEPRKTDQPRDLLRSPAGRVANVPVSRVEASSTEVRRRIRAGEPVDDLLAAPVLAYVQRHGLYRR